ncbi:MAG: hypothetical protein E7554_10400 [Ruminococcaceae bacterium]|nr:hypothetical protein [Oscillospiraceae bacterium]
MICPCCDTINKDEAKVCRSCGIRLTGRKARPEDEEREKKYLTVGIITVIAAVLFLTVFISLSSCICSGCVEENAGENVITDEVGGDYFDDTASSGDLLISYTDTSDAETQPEEVPAE